MVYTSAFAAAFSGGLSLGLLSGICIRRRATARAQEDNVVPLECLGNELEGYSFKVYTRDWRLDTLICGERSNK